MLKNSTTFTITLVLIASFLSLYLFNQHFEITLKNDSTIRTLLKNSPNGIPSFYKEFFNEKEPELLKQEEQKITQEQRALDSRNELEAILRNIESNAARARLNEQIDAKRQREANALMNLGAIIGGWTPAPSSTRSKVTTPSYPTYTSSRTVPSNQLCPQLVSRLVKQEVVRGNRICYYQ